MFWNSFELFFNSFLQTFLSVPVPGTYQWSDQVNLVLIMLDAALTQSWAALALRKSL